MKIKFGTYSGNGTSQSITGVGFQPDFVLIKEGALNIGCLRSIDMVGNNTKPIAGATASFAGGITSIDADGFSVGSDARANNSGVTHYWMALQDDGAGDLFVGTYTGDGTTTHAITGFGFQPECVLVWQNPNTRVILKTSSDGENSADYSQSLTSAGGSTTSIKTLDADGFSVGADASVNTNTNTYYYIGWKSVAGTASTGFYTGDATDNRSITGIGFQPEFVFVQAFTVVANTAMIRFPAQVGDSSFRVDNAAETNSIQARESDGFQVGTSARVNTSTAKYRWFAFKVFIAPVAKTASDTYTLEDAIEGTSNIIRSFDVVDTLTVEDGIDVAVLAVTTILSAADTLTLEDAIDASALDVSGPILNVAADTYTLEDGIEGTSAVTIFIEAADTYTLDDAIDAVTALSAEVTPGDFYYFTDDPDSAFIFVEYTAEDTYTFDDEVLDDGTVLIRTGGLSWHFYVDWQGDGFPSDEIDYVLFPFHLQRGGNDLNDSIGVGTAEILLENSTGRFSPMNSSSPVYPYVTGNNIPFQLVFELYNEPHPIFTGFIRDVKQAPLYEDATVALICVDVADILSGEEIRDELYENEYTGDIFAAILAASDFSTEYTALVLSQGAVGFWRFLEQGGQLLYDTFASESQNYVALAPSCVNDLLPAETGQPWVMYCHNVGGSGYTDWALYSIPFWKIFNTNITYEVAPGVEVRLQQQSGASVPDHFIVIAAEAGEQNVTHTVTLNQTRATAYLADTEAGRANAYGALAIVRLTDIDNFIYVEQTVTGYQLVKREAGVNTVLDTVAMAVGVTDVLRVDTLGNDIVVLVNGTGVLSATTSFNATATKHGFGRLVTASSLEFLRFGSVQTFQRTVQDSSANNSDGVYYGTPDQSFTGGDYADLGDIPVPAPTTYLMLEAWYKPNTLDDMPIVVKENTFGLRQVSSKIEAFVVIGATEYTTPLTGVTESVIGRSRMVTLRWNDAILELYSNGQLVSNVVTPGGAIDDIGNSLLVGKEGATVADADIWDVSLYVLDSQTVVSDIEKRYMTKTVLGINRSIDRGRQQLQLYAPSGKNIWDAGQELAYEEIGGHCFVNASGIIIFQDRYALSREQIYVRLENTGLIDAPIDVLHDDNYDFARAKWHEFNTFDEENQWIIWHSIVADAENHARMNKLIKPGAFAPENEFSGTWEKSGIQIRPGSIDPNTHIIYTVTTQPSPGVDIYNNEDVDSTVQDDVVIAEFTYDDLGFTIVFNNVTDEDRYIFNVEIKIAESAVIQRLPIDFNYQLPTGFLRKTGRTRLNEYNWNTDIDVIRSSVVVRSKIGATIHPRPDGLLADVTSDWVKIILLADIGKRISVIDTNFPHSTHMNDEYIIKGIQLSIGEEEITAVWSLWDKVLAEAHYFIIGQDSIDGPRVITF